MITIDQFNAMSDIQKAEAFAKLSAAKAPTKLTMKVSKAGAMSIYGFGRWPVTLYRNAWLRVLDSSEEIRAFLEQNESLLSTGKDDPRFAKDVE